MKIKKRILLCLALILSVCVAAVHTAVSGLTANAEEENELRVTDVRLMRNNDNGQNHWLVRRTIRYPRLATITILRGKI